VRYYVYISDSKLDMLYPQVPHALKQKVSTDLKVDLKLFGGSRTTEKETEENRMTKLETVVRFVEENEDVGTVDSDGSYFADTLEMRWGIPQLRDATVGARVPSGLVSFGAIVGDTSVGLFGSACHLVGVGGTPQTGDIKTTMGGESTFFNIAAAVNGMFGQDQTEVGRGDLTSNDEVLQQFVLFTQRMSGPQQRLEFLAKRLAVGTARDGRRVLIGTPLYVALAD
jgi:hypothetical protein